MRPRRQFWEGLAGLLGAGIPIRTALAQLSGRAAGGWGRSLRRVRDEVERGRSLADAMAFLPGEFRPLEIELVRAGEASGALEGAARDLAAEEERGERVRGRLLVTTLYPICVLHMVPVPLNVGTLVRHGFGAFLRGYFSWILPAWAVVAVLLALRARYRNDPRYGRLLLAIPVTGGVLRDLALVRWARAFAALEDAGIGADACTRGAAACTGYENMRAALAAPAPRVASGTSRTDAFAGAPLPPELYQALALGESSGTIAASLRKAAGGLEHSTMVRVDSILATAPIVAYVVAGAAVAYAAFQVFGNYYSGLGGL